MKEDNDVVSAAADDDNNNGYDTMMVTIITINSRKVWIQSFLKIPL